MSGYEGRVGFVGVGNIGAPMAVRVCSWPGGAYVVDVNADALAPFGDLGAEVGTVAADAAEVCGVVCVMVNTEAQVRGVLFDEGGLVEGHRRSGRERTYVAVHSTISPAGAAAMAVEADRHGVEVLDAPVSGGAMGAASGELAVMVGGTADALAVIKPVLATFGGKIRLFGPTGSGTRAKVARNLITFASFAAVGEAMRLAEADGIDVAALGDIVRHSDRITGGPGAVMLRSTAQPMDPDDALRPIFEHSASLGDKDLALAIALGDDLGVDTPMASLARRLVRSALGLDEYPDSVG